jgi:hypothetical protein
MIIKNTLCNTSQQKTPSGERWLLLPPRRLCGKSNWGKKLREKQLKILAYINFSEME